MNDVKIGIGITTHNNELLRKRISEESFRWVTAKCPINAEVVVIDDASHYRSDWTRLTPNPDKLTTWRWNSNQGVAKSKNKCLEILMDKGCTDIFLFDDDCWIQDARYYYEYCYQDLPHMNLYPIEHINNPNKIKSHFKFKDQIFVEAFPYGSALYFKRDLIEKVGGFNILLGKFGEEHGEFEERIYNHKYTPKPSFDFYRSNKDYPIIIHPNTFHSQASSMRPETKKRSIQEAQANRKIYGGIDCPYRESEYTDFLKNYNNKV